MCWMKAFQVQPSNSLETWVLFLLVRSLLLIDMLLFFMVTHDMNVPLDLMDTRSN